MAETTYIVLRRRQENPELPAVWEVVGENDGADVPWIGSNASAAIRKALDGKPTVERGTYVAVPARNWKPVNVQAVQTTVLKIEDASALEHLTPG